MGLIYALTALTVANVAALALSLILKHRSRLRSRQHRSDGPVLIVRPGHRAQTMPHELMHVEAHTDPDPLAERYRRYTQRQNT